MTPYYVDPLVTLHLGDCLDVMATLEAESVDAVVTDPPAGIGFMAREWDDFRRSRNANDVGRDNVFGRTSAKGPEYARRSREAFVSFMEQVMAECYRLLKPGGHAVVWAIPRTSHWTAWAIEDAGFEVRDCLTHIFASGFPKSLNAGNGWGTALKPASEHWWLARKPLVGTVAANVTRYGTGALNIDGTRIGVSPTDDIHAKNPHTDNRGRDGGWVTSGSDGARYEVPAGRWPSNVLLDPEHPELFDEPNPGVVGSGATAPGAVSNGKRTGNGYHENFGPMEQAPSYGDSGGYSRFFIVPKADRAERERGLTPSTSAPVGSGTSGSLACATCDRLISGQEWQSGELRCGHPHKAAYRKKPNVPRGNTHPTVKSLDLMRHLVRLVTPPGPDSVILDPFLGSGTTALAASEEGFKCIGIEREADYLEIAKGRLMATPMGFGLSEPVA